MNKKLLKIQNIDSLIFSLLTRQKIIVAGEEKEITELISLFENIFPSKMLNITINEKLNELNENFQISRLSITDKTMKLLDRNKDDYTIVFLPSYEIYGKYTSRFCRKVSSLFKKDELTSVTEELTQFITKVNETDELMPPAEYASKFNIPKNDASLLMWMRSLNSGKEFDKSFYIDLE